jgi:hypothetical protein
LSETIVPGIPKHGKYFSSRHDNTALEVIFRTGYIATNLEKPSRTTNNARFP